MTTIQVRLATIDPSISWSMDDRLIVVTVPHDAKLASSLFTLLSELVYTYSDYLWVSCDDSIEPNQVGLSLKPGSSWADLELAMNSF